MTPEERLMLMEMEEEMIQYHQFKYEKKIDDVKKKLTRKKDNFISNPIVRILAFFFKLGMMLPIAIMIYAIFLAIFGPHPAEYLK